MFHRDQLSCRTQNKRLIGSRQVAAASYHPPWAVQAMAAEGCSVHERRTAQSAIAGRFFPRMCFLRMNAVETMHVPFAKRQLEQRS